MPKISSLRRPRAVKVKLDEDLEVEVQYQPGAVTPDWQDRFAGLSEDGRKLSNTELIPILTEVITGWDVTEDDGSALPPNEENLRQFPAFFLYEIIDAVFGEMTPKKLRSAPSDAG